MRRIALILVFALSGCGPRGEMVVIPEAAQIGTDSEVFIGTTRRLDAKTHQFVSARSDTLTLARYDVSIPPAHQPGKIEWPGRAPADPEKNFVVSEEQIFKTDRAFRADLARALRQNNGEATVFVHGFNNTFSEGLYRIAQLSYDLKVPGVTTHYSWPSLAKAVGYVSDRDSSTFARDGLEQFLHELEAAGAKRILIVAHSMGSALTMETLRQIAISGDRRVLDRISGVVLISPDIDVDVFRLQAQRMGKLPQPFVIFGSTRDKALSASAMITGQRNRLGSISDVGVLGDLDVIYLDVEAFSTGGGHFNVGENPALISLLSGITQVDRALGNDMVRMGLVDGVVVNARRATKVVLSPVSAVSKGLSQ
jgi:esterase/lipase superfamily enzyme